MKIRKRYLIIFLAISLIPLIISSLAQRFSIRRLGNHLAGELRGRLKITAKQNLQDMVNDYQRALGRDRALLQLLLRMQAREAELRLAWPPPAPPTKVYFHEDYESDPPPPGTRKSDQHINIKNEHSYPVPVSYDHQVYFLPESVDRKTVQDEIARLSTMTEVYRKLHDSHPHLMHWQYTALESGLHSSYPGHGGIPKSFDPRKRPWYKLAKQQDDLDWTPPIVDASTGKAMFTLAMPVRNPDGSFAGVTAIDITLTSIIQRMKLPRQWQDEATTMFVVRQDRDVPEKGQLLILARRRYEKQNNDDWQSPIKLTYLKSDSPEMKDLLDSVAAGRPGINRIKFKGKDCLWAFGTSRDGEAFPVVILPHDTILAQADAAENYITEKTVMWLQVSGAFLFFIAVLVFFVAYRRSRKITKPILQLTDAGKKLAEGDFHAKVNIRTGDELQQLGEVFNTTGPQLAEREKMKRSLAIAMEIQQHLLPKDPPKLDGFDIAGSSFYCDETGGDYYDFIELMELGPDKLGIAVGDVTGHGIAAALLMASARGVLRSHAEGHGTDLGKLFMTLNQHLVRDVTGGRFMTLFYGILDQKTRRLHWTSGGHDPALWLRHNENCFEELPNTGMPLGIMEDAVYDNCGPIQMDPGDIIVIGTDGIWEAANPADEMFGKDRLREILTTHSKESARKIFDAVLEAVRSFQGVRQQEDDITLVVIKAL